MTVENLKKKFDIFKYTVFNNYKHQITKMLNRVEPYDDARLFLTSNFIFHNRFSLKFKQSFYFFKSKS